MSAFLLDTHALLWRLDDDRWLGSAAGAAIATGEVFVSIAQATSEQLPLMTSDRHFAAYGITLLPCSQRSLQPPPRPSTARPATALK